jgi:hypothetical protein
MGCGGDKRRHPFATATAIASATRLILAIQLALVVALLAVGEPVLRWFGPEFTAGHAATVILALAETIQGAFSITDLLLLYMRAGLALLVTLAMIFVNMLTSLPLIAAYGNGGAALSVLIAFIAGALLRRFLLRARFDVSTPLLHSAGPLLAGAAAAAVAVMGHRYVPAAAPLQHQMALLSAVIAVYAGGIFVWQRATGETLKLTGFRAEIPYKDGLRSVVEWRAADRATSTSG